MHWIYLFPFISQMTLCVHTIVSSLSWPRIVLVGRNILVVHTLYVLTVRAQNTLTMAQTMRAGACPK